MTPTPPAPANASPVTTMTAIVQHGYGDAEVWQVGEIPRPQPGAHEVLVHVRAAGLDRGTWHQMAGLPYPFRLAVGLRTPRNPVPGLDVAGVVVEVRSEVTGLRAGDEVYGTARGSFAEYAVAAEDKLARKPVNLTFAQAAAVPVSGLTAIQALTDVGRVEPGQRVLVLGASGGVGTYAVQIAKALGAEVTGVCSAAKVDLVSSLGAEHVLDYERDDATDGTRQYDLILDIGGNTALSKLRRALAPHGVLVIVGGEEGGRWLGGLDRQVRALAWSPFVGQRLTTFLSKERARDLERLTELIEEGRVVPSVERAYPLADAPEAMRHLAAGRARGKLVLVV